MSIEHLREIIEEHEGDDDGLNLKLATAIHAHGYLRLEEVVVDWNALDKFIEIYSQGTSGVKAMIDHRGAEAHRSEWLKPREA